VAGGRLAAKGRAGGWGAAGAWRGQGRRVAGGQGAAGAAKGRLAGGQGAAGGRPRGGQADGRPPGPGAESYGGFSQDQVGESDGRAAKSRGLDRIESFWSRSQNDSTIST